MNEAVDVLIHTKDLTKKFGQQISVDRINLEIRRGQIYGFLGPNGAGKTTTIRMLLGLMKPSTGSVRIFGKSLEEDRIEILSKVGSLVESPSYYRNLTGYENLEATRQLIGASKSEIERVLDIVRLEEVAHQLVKGYSLGMRQRLGIALALLGNPELLILDEPTNGLDPAGIHEIRELIKRLPQEYGLTVLISSHNLNEIELIATHVGIIQKGKMIFQGTIQELQERSQPVLQIQVDQPEEASQFLRESGIAVIRQGDVLHIVGHEKDAGSLNKILIHAGYEVSRLYLQTRSLEDIFLELTGGEGTL
ncbi:ABC transporter ATP-binding protein [Effusibacillus consociatus]|uniref:ATP-binding cassette domain-containing protein n=1 Tax=Effusibacillus consociatus TaxID=1117041 RepID=A0ABV9Q254_9BACL